MNKIFFLISLIIFAASCKPIKKVSSNTTNQVDAIQIAIGDFSKNCRLYRTADVFYVSKQGATNNENIIIISITKDFSKILLTKETKVGSKGHMPTRYVEMKGKLFYWWDKDYPLTEEALSVFRKHNLLQDDMEGAIKMPDQYFDEEQKSANYYFCKNNLSIYKRVVTNDGRLYGQSPKINCKCDSLKH